MNVELLKSILHVRRYDNKIRLGCNHDGGYVIAVLDNQYDCYISAGVGSEESFSRDIDDWGCDFDDKIKCINKLLKNHFIVHAHGNNHAHVVDGVPDVIELTLLNKNCFYC